LGFASFSEIIDLEPKTYKLHKLYLLPESQGKNVGSHLITEIEKKSKNKEAEYLILNVNRNNSAYHFYLKKGYTVRETVDIPFAEFVLNDYVMEKKLN
jgi:ribosomal protein S18 acetylase RimI-like enzyme